MKDFHYSTEFEELEGTPHRVEFRVTLHLHRRKNESSFDRPTKVVDQWRGPDVAVLYQWAMDAALADARAYEEEEAARS